MKAWRCCEPILATISFLGCSVGVWGQAQTTCSIQPGGSGAYTHFIYYDARQNKFFYDKGTTTPPTLRTGEHALLAVCRAHFGEQFEFAVLEKSFPEAGAEVRGLDEAAGLIPGIPRVPGAKGIVPFEEVTIAPYKDVASLVNRMRSLDDAIGFKTELQIEFDSVQRGRTLLDEAFEEYRRAVCRLSQRIPGVDCSDVKGAYEVDRVEQTISKLQNEVRTAESLASNTDPDPACRASFTPSPLPPVYPDRSQFVCFVNQTNSIIQRFKTLRTAMGLPPIGSSAADLASGARQLQMRITTFSNKLVLAQAATSMAQVLLDAETQPGGNAPPASKLSSEVGLSRLKKLRETYKDVVTSEDLQRIAEDLVAYRSRQEVQRIRDTLANLQATAVPDYQSKLIGVTDYLKNKFVPSVEARDQALAQRVRDVNAKLASLMKDIKALYDKSEVPPISVQALSWSGNTGVTISVKVKDSFRPPDLNKLETVAPAGAISALAGPLPLASPSSFTGDGAATVSAGAGSVPNPASKAGGGGSGGASGAQGAGSSGPGTRPGGSGAGAASTGSTGPASGTTTTSLTVSTNASTAFEVHKTYRFNVAGGLLFSNLKQNNFALRNVTRLDANGNPVLDANGNPVTDLKLVPTGTDRVRLDFPLFLTTYLGKRLDVFSTTSANRLHWGSAVGFSTSDVSNNAYLGGFIQPHLGLDLLFGLHLGRRNVPDPGFVPNVTRLKPGTTDLPVHKEWKRGFFFTIGFDALTLKKLIGKSP